MIKIHVTQEDINNGFVGNSEFCPVALAVKRATNADKVSIYDTFGISIADEIIHTGRTPKAAVDFIETFDKCGKSAVKPFSFDLEFES